MAAEGIRGWVEALRGGRVRSDRARAIADLFYRRSLYDSAGEFYRAVAELFPHGDVLDAASLGALAEGLRDHGADGGLGGDDREQEVELWRELTERTESDYARGCYADSLLQVGRKEEALEQFLRAFEGEPQLVAELGGDVENLAKAVGGDALFRYRLVDLRCAISAGDDEVRERYSELLEDVGRDAAAVERVRQVGREIDAAVARGDLPRAMVRRGPTRPQE